MEPHDPACSACGCGDPRSAVGGDGNDGLRIAGPAPSDRKVATHRIRVAELDCQEEIGLLRRQLGDRPGIVELRFDLLDRRVDIDVADGGPDSAQLVRLIRDTGLSPLILAAASRTDSADGADELRFERRRARRAAIVLIIGAAANLFGLLWPPFAGSEGLAALAHSADSFRGELAVVVPSLVAHLVAIVVCGLPLLPRAWAAVRLGRADMNVLMTVAVAGALAIGEWAEAGIVTWLFALALRLEQLSLGRARDAIGRLMSLAPPVARPAGSSATVPIGQIEVGTAIDILPGDRVPLDGRILAGATDIDRSALTGESRPVPCSVGDSILAGSVNLTGDVTIETTRIAGETHLDRVAAALREAQQRRGRTERWVDRFAAIYTPTVMGLALAAALLLPLTGRTPLEAIYVALVLLVTACPCALVISTPVTIVASLAGAARRGLILRGGEAIERLAQVDTVLFDKTGTLTTGATRVERVVAASGTSERDLLRLAASLEVRSTHPLASAIVSAERNRTDRDPAPLPQLSTRIVPGSGIEQIGEDASWIGNERMLRAKVAADRIDPSIESTPDAVATSVWIGKGGELLGRIDLGDSLRPEARGAVERLAALGIGRTGILSGDRASVVSSFGRELRIDDARGELLPDDKVQAIELLRSRGAVVLMVGDGANDAAALAAADVSLAMGRCGTDLARSAADGVLVHDDLRRIPWALEHARRSRSILIQNLTAAIASKGIFFALALAGFSTLWLAILADTGVSLAVIANGLRGLGRRDD